MSEDIPEKSGKQSGRQRTPALAPCSKCGRIFSRKDSLVRHLKVHSSDNERGPLHRIVHEKFRACSPCRRAKVRCPGNFPCARCEQLHQDCNYGSAKGADNHRKTPSSPDSGTSDLKNLTLPPILSPQPSPPDQERTKSPPRTQPLRDHSEGSLATEATERQTSANVLSPARSTSSMLQPNVAPEQDILATLLQDNKVPSMVQSPYVSPTLHILDPYSYKLPSIADSQEGFTATSTTPSLATCRYPVLQYISPFLDREFSPNLACDLLDTYFSSAFSSRMHPTCHHLHNFLVRRCDVLDPVRPRMMHPALIASMLFVASLSDKALGLFSGPEERDRICKYLSLLTYRLLYPSRLEPLLSYEDLGLPATCASTLCWTNEDLQRALDPNSRMKSLPITWGTDYIITFIHVSSVISGSEKKAASIRWWSVAFNLARDLRLNHEVSSTITIENSSELQSSENCRCSTNHEASNDTISEVHREERRRTWWLLFLMDRHLALCYNRSLALLEAECQDLLLPLDDITWQSGAQPHSHGNRSDGPRCVIQPSDAGRAHGPPILCSGVGLFQFFLPLMTITGHLLDFNRAKNHPVLVSAGPSMWSSQERQIWQELDAYQTSLEGIKMRQSHERTSESGPSWTTSPRSTVDDSETTHIVTTASAYASHVVSVLRILVGSKWDPVCLFEDSDFWTSSPGFKDSMSHTIAASECVTQILESDPDISFMPYFFGIQLLHGSLLLLLVAYRLQADSGTVILTACEAVVRATEACFVTLPTDYQRQFRNVMRSAIALAKGRRNNPTDTEKQLASVLARYRWSRNGGGLAR